MWHTYSTQQKFNRYQEVVLILIVIIIVVINNDYIYNYTNKIILAIPILKLNVILLLCSFFTSV